MTRALTNPLRRPRPARSERVFRRRVYFTDERGRVFNQVAGELILTRDVAWLNAENAIPFSAIRLVEIVERRGLPRRRFLRLEYVNPITGGPEIACLAVLDFLGFYDRKALEQLVAELDRLRLEPPHAETAGEAGLAEGLERADASKLDCCEVCGARPAYYVPYVYQVAVLLFAWRSGSRRRVHCRRHNLQYGLVYYAATALLGWPILNPAILVSYPVTAYNAGRNLTPSLGKAAYVLAAAPGLIVAVMLAVWMVRAFS